MCRVDLVDWVHGSKNTTAKSRECLQCFAGTATVQDNYLSNVSGTCFIACLHLPCFSFLQSFKHPISHYIPLPRHRSNSALTVLGKYTVRQIITYNNIKQTTSINRAVLWTLIVCAEVQWEADEGPFCDEGAWEANLLGMALFTWGVWARFVAVKACCWCLDYCCCLNTFWVQVRKVISCGSAW